MDTQYIAASTAHLLKHMAYDYASEPLTGLTTLIVRILRPSDGFFWNWNTNAFVSAPASGDRDKALVEFSSTTVPGLYTVSWPGTVAGEYIAYFEQSSGGTDYNCPETVALSVGAFATASAVAALPSAADVWAAGTRTLTAIGASGIASQVSVDALPTAAATADAVWDELLAGHVTAGSAGAALALVDVAVSTRATAAGVWATAEGSPSAGTMGYAQVLGRKHITNRLVVSVAGGEVLYDDDATTPLKTWALTDGAGNAITTPSGSPARRGAAT